MGFFDSLWSGIKNTAGSVWNGIKNTAGTVYQKVGQGLNWVADNVKPTVDAIARYGAFVPGIGPALSAGASAVSGYLGTAKGIYDKVGDAGRKIGTGVDDLGRIANGVQRRQVLK
jgi:phage-related protein